MLLLTFALNRRFRTGRSIERAASPLSGNRVPGPLSAPTVPPIHRDEPLEPFDAEEPLPSDVRKLIEGALSSGRPLREIEDCLDWLDNARPLAGGHRQLNEKDLHTPISSRGRAQP